MKKPTAEEMMNAPYFSALFRLNVARMLSTITDYEDFKVGGGAHRPTIYIDKTDRNCIHNLSIDNLDDRKTIKMLAKKYFSHQDYAYFCAEVAKAKNYREPK